MPEHIGEQSAEKLAGNTDDHEYDLYCRVQSARVAALGRDVPLFTTDAADLFLIYLAGFEDAQRQYHNCNACRHYIERYGGLVWIDAEGRAEPVLWRAEDAPAHYQTSIGRLVRAVKAARVTGVFLTSLDVLGQPQTGAWRHFSVKAPGSTRHRALALTAGQAMAEKAQDFQQVARALDAYSLETLQRVVALLETETLYRAERVIGPARWLLSVKRALEDQQGQTRANLLWRFIATAPAGYCHPRSSMVGTLLEDLQSGLTFEVASARFADKMHPANYQRPQAPPARGNIEAAEKLIERLGLAPALRRRYAQLSEVHAVWRPQAETTSPKPRKGIFADVPARGEAAAKTVKGARGVAITFDKLRRTVLPTAERVRIWVPESGNFGALVTACDADAPPLLQWDQPEQRNPVSWYVYTEGSQAVKWGLTGEKWVDVAAVTLQPNLWCDDPERYAHQGKGAIFIIDGARDQQGLAGLAIFPETLRSDLRPARATLSAHSAQGALEGADVASACGLFVQATPGRESARISVLSREVWTEYQIDRWD